jgi:hypothetical protein
MQIAKISFCPRTTTISLEKPGKLSRHFRKTSTPAGVVEEEEFQLEKLKIFGTASVKQLQLSSCFIHEFQTPVRL